VNFGRLASLASERGATSTFAEKISQQPNLKDLDSRQLKGMAYCCSASPSCLPAKSPPGRGCRTRWASRICRAWTLENP
jgi:hypothetical protein